jgi:DNA helicase-2/ATP-dependent DNA helicase PcrA
VNWQDLTEDQQRAASSEARRLLVFGRAGSGKTTVALWCARCFLESPQARSWHRVLFLTFSRTAVREISRRSGRALAGIRAFIEIQTFHGFSSRILTSFGRYAGFGKNPPYFQSDAEARLLGRNEGHLVYDDLLPRALEAIRVPRLKRLLSERWPVVICDEFQDTDDLQWELLCELAEAGRLVLFADPNQMIYDGFLGHRGVGPKRVEQARGLADLVVDLGAPSHRDPTNLIPAMAAAVRRRRFNDPAVEAALEQDRLRIQAHVTDELLIETVKAEIADAGSTGARTVGIFGHSNQGVAGLSAELFRAGVDHMLIGLPEAHGEAFAALEGLCLYGLGRTDLVELKLRLASSSRRPCEATTPRHLLSA